MEPGILMKFQIMKNPSENSEFTTQVETQKGFMQKLSLGKWPFRAMLMMSLAGGFTSCGSEDESTDVEIVNVEKSFLFEAHQKKADKLLSEWKIEAAEDDNIIQASILEAAQNYSDNEVLAVMIKESYLEADAEGGGYMQLTDTTLRELRRLIPVAQVSDEKASNAPSYNLAYGRLYLAALRVHYVDRQEKVFGNLNETDRHRLVRLMYNMGPTSIKAMWIKFDCDSVDDLVLAMEDHVHSNIDYPNKAWMHGRETQFDERYKVEYDEADVVKHYLTNPSNLDGGAFVEGKYPSMKKLLISARYERITSAIVEKLEEDRDAYLDSISPSKDDTGTPIEGGEMMDVKATQEITIQKGDTMYGLTWRYGVSEGYLKNINGGLSIHLKLGQKIVVPAESVQQAVSPYLHTLPNGKHWIQASRKGIYGHPDYQRYFKEEIHIEDQEEILEVVIAFNRQFNPELRDLKNDFSNVPKGAFIWLPNVEFYEDDIEGHFIPEPPTIVHPEPVAPEAIPNTELLDTSTPGQYVIKVGGEWRRDVDEMREGAETFPVKTWEDHPAWTSRDGFPRSRRIARFEMDEVAGIVLHSTITPNLNGVHNDRNAHFGVERDGTIYRIVHVPNDPNNEVSARDTVAKHAGRSTWDGEQNLNQSWLGIEVVADEDQPWSEAQFDAVQDLVEWAGGYYGLQKNEVLMHKQVAYHRKWGRGRKSDVQCGPGENHLTAESNFYDDLGLPDNSRILDLDVAQNYTPGNWSRIDAGRDGHTNQGWIGLEAAVNRDDWATD